jgi:hypothetical protein
MHDDAADGDRHPVGSQRVRGDRFRAGFFLVGAALLRAAFAVFLARGATVPRPTTVSAPGPGMSLDSSPEDQRTMITPPVTPVTTPVRGSWPTFWEAS